VADFSILKEALWFGVRSMVSHLVGTLNFQFDVLLVFVFLGARAAGPYAIVELLANSLFFVPTAISTAILPVLSRTDGASAVALVNRGLRLSVAVGALSGFLLVIVARLVLPLYGQAYLNAWPALVALAPGVAFSSLVHIATVYWEAHVREPHVNLYVAAISLLLGSLADLWLIPHIGLVGAGIGATFGYTAMTVTTLILFWRRSGTNPRESLVPRLEDLYTLLAGLRGNRASVT
jgi:O-antigen/teichoic acid export membrane protein